MDSSATTAPAMPPDTPSDHEVISFPCKEAAEIDHSKIFGFVAKPDKDKPLWCLSFHQGRYQLLYFNEKAKKCRMNLRTDNPHLARRIRDHIYQKVTALGRGGVTKMERYCQAVLLHPETDHGISFVVHFASQKAVCDSLKQARLARAEMARRYLEAKKNKVCPDYRDVVPDMRRQPRKRKEVEV